MSRPPTRQLAKLARLTGSDRRLLASAAALLAAFRLGLWLLPFDVIRRAAARLERPRRGTARSRPSGSAIAHRIVWAVDVASRYVPGSENCLNRALAAKVLLARRGFPARLRFGVRRGARGELLAHAWVEGPEGVLIGNVRGITRYAPLRAPDELNKASEPSELESVER